MIVRKNINGLSIPEIWQKIYNDFVANGVSNYHAAVDYDGNLINLDMVSSPGGSEEGGYDYTTISAPLPQHSRLSFSMQPEDFLKKIGKFFGAQDVVVGYKEFDERIIIKTNDEAKLRDLFSNEKVREVFKQLSGYSFGVVEDDEQVGRHLELTFQRATADIPELQRLFEAFAEVLNKLKRTD